MARKLTLPRTVVYVALISVVYCAFDITASWCAGKRSDSLLLMPYRLFVASPTPGNIEGVVCSKVAAVEGAYNALCPNKKSTFFNILYPTGNYDSDFVGPICKLADRFRATITFGDPAKPSYPWLSTVFPAIGQFFTAVVARIKGALFLDSDSVCPSGCPEGGRLDKAFKDIYLHLNGELAFFGFETNCSCELFEDADYRWRKNQFKAMVYGGTAVFLCIGGIIFAFLSRPDEQVNWSTLTRAVVSKFKAIRLLHSNANVNIFLMQQRSSHRWAFVKCLRADCSRLTRRNFTTEIQALKTIKQTYIVEMLDWFHVGTRYSFALEFAPFGSLDATIANQQDSYSLAEKRGIFRQLIEAVGWLHNMNWVHLNIRAASVLVFDMWFTVKLSGFSHAFRTNEQRTCMVYDLHPNCCSPQVKRQQPYDPYQADVWALRALFLYISTGQRMSSDQSGDSVFTLDQCSDAENDLSYTEQLFRVMADYFSNEVFDRNYVSAVMD